MNAYELESEFDMANVVMCLLRKNKTRNVWEIIRNRPELHESTLRQMGTNNLAKEGANFIKKLGVNHEDYPEIIQ